MSSVIGEMVRKLVDALKPQQIILFGSHARGTAGPDSDVDLMLVFSSLESRKKKAREAYRILSGMGVSKDIVVVTQEDVRRYRDVIGTVIRPALKEGKVMYEQAA